ncbi:MAG: hypothetical protein ACIALR_06950, partial [Blastopirellula sp. JB062]
RFLTLFQMVDGKSKPLPVEYDEQEETYVVGISDRLVVMSNDAGFIQKSFPLTVPDGGARQVALLGLKTGNWIVKSGQGEIVAEVAVEAGAHAIYFQAAPGQYQVTLGE